MSTRLVVPLVPLRSAAKLKQLNIAGRASGGEVLAAFRQSSLPRRQDNIRDDAGDLDIAQSIPVKGLLPTQTTVSRNYPANSISSLPHMPPAQLFPPSPVYRATFEARFANYPGALIQICNQ
jgi:hypothetical protein